MVIYILGAFLLSLILGSVSIPIILDFCKRKRLYDIPNERKVHKNAIPRLGGVVFFPNMLIALAMVMLMMNPLLGNHTHYLNLWTFNFLISLIIIYLTGLADDLIGLNAKIKFCAQIIAATFMPLSGLCINNLYGLFGIHELSFLPSALLTVFTMVFIMNAINMIDGIDGLAASLSFVALCGFLFCFYKEGMDIYCTLIAGVMGGLLAFLYFNMFGEHDKNRKIFMGDSGSLTLGFILSFLSVKFSSLTLHGLPFYLNGLIVPVTLLLVPIFDTIRVIIVRTRHRLHLFKADKNHIHHKLMRAGLTQHQTLCVIISVSIAYVVINFLLIRDLTITGVLLIDIVCFMLLHGAINLKIKKRGEVVTIV